MPPNPISSPGRLSGSSAIQVDPLSPADQSARIDRDSPPRKQRWLRMCSPARIAILELLASQAAISLENTRLYGDLRERGAKVRRLVDSNIIGICIFDFDGAVMEANEAFLRIVGYGRDDLMSGRLRWTDLTPPEWSGADDRALTEVAATGTCRPYEKEFFRKDGSRVPVLMAGANFDELRHQGVAFVARFDRTKARRSRAGSREPCRNNGRTHGLHRP